MDALLANTESIARGLHGHLQKETKRRKSYQTHLEEAQTEVNIHSPEQII